MPAARALSSPSGEVAAEDNVVERENFWGRRNYIMELRYGITDYGRTDRRGIWNSILDMIFLHYFKSKINMYWCLRQQWRPLENSKPVFEFCRSKNFDENRTHVNNFSFVLIWIWSGKIQKPVLNFQGVAIAASNISNRSIRRSLLLLQQRIGGA